MSRRWPWSGRRTSSQIPDGVDPELWAIFQAPEGADRPQLMTAAQELRRRIQAQPPAPADPAFQTRLRTNLMAEARAGKRPTVRARRFALPLSATLGIAGLAAAAVVVITVVALPLQRGQVEIQAAVSGHHQVPVTQAIRISFNRPMDESAVLRGLTIKPAVSYQARWPNPKTLLLSPAHGLAPNVGYVVTIAKPAAKAQNGAEASSGIVIPFGTGSAPSTPHGQIPTLVSVTQVPVTTGVTSVSYMPDGALLVLASGAPSAVPSPTPSASPTASPVGPPSSGLTFGDLYVLTPALRGVATDSAGAVASPDSQEIAYWTPASFGTLSLDVVPALGNGTPETLATSAESDPGLAWLDNGDLLYAAAGQLREVSLDGQITAVDPSVHVDPSGFFTVSPSAQALFARPGGVPTIYSLPSGSATAISTLVGTPAWAASGTDLAYIADSDGDYTIDSSSDLGAQSTVLFTASAGSQLSDLSFDPTGTYLTYLSTTSALSSQLTALNIQSKVFGTLSNLSAVGAPVWDPTGSQLTLLAATASGTTGVETLLVSGGPQVTSSTDAAAAAALATASNLAQIQVTSGPVESAEIAALLAPGTVLPPSVLEPGKFDRFYAVSTTPTSAGASSYTVDLHLVRDATSSSAPAYLPEMVTVQTGGPAPLISNISPGQLTAVPNGPLVLSVTSSTDRSDNTVFVIHFDSDLNPQTLGSQSISLSVNGHAISGAQFDYSALTRTETVTVAGLPSGAVTLTVGPPLADINNTPMQSAYVVVLQPQANSAG